MQGRAEAAWDEGTVAGRIKDQAGPAYPTVKSMRGFLVHAQFTLAPPGTEAPQTGPARHEERGWVGLRLESADGRQIAVFARDRFTFSRLKPYEVWERFSGEALRLWQTHATVSAATEVQRLGVRFINRLEVPLAGLDFEDYFEAFASPPREFPVAAFLHQDTLAVPDYPYLVNVRRTFQPPQGDGAETLAILLDIDVFSAEPLPADLPTITRSLAEMHWLKNRAFFGSLTKRALDLCR